MVCENHPELAWPDRCDCGAGMPCLTCRVQHSPMGTEEAQQHVVQRAVEVTTSLPPYGRR
jgi:hypothetical protein